MYDIPSYMYVMWASLVGASAISLWHYDWPSLFISLFTLLLTAYAVYLSNKSEVTVPAPLLSAAIIFIYCTLFLGEVADFYEKLWWWDAVLHFGSALGFGLIGLIILILMFRRKRVTASPFLIACFAFSFAMAIGALWEIFEFTMDQLFGLSMQKSGLIDTMYDLIVDTVGAVIASVAGFYYLAERKKTGLNAVIHEAVVENKELEL